MALNDDIWLDARDAWGADRLAWEDEDDADEDDGPASGAARPKAALDDPRY